MIDYVVGATSPSTTISWHEAGVLVDFSTGWTFAAKMYAPGSGVTAITKSSGISGAATDPNVTINWTAGDLGALAAGLYALEVTATNGGAVYRRQWSFRVAAAAP